MERPVFCTRLDDELQQRFDDYRRATGMTASGAMRALMWLALNTRYTTDGTSYVDAASLIAPAYREGCAVAYRRTYEAVMSMLDQIKP
jgi:hypothetical protein